MITENKTKEEKEMKDLIKKWKNEESKNGGFTDDLKIDYNTVKENDGIISVEFKDTDAVNGGTDEGRINFEIDSLKVLDVDIF